MIWVLLGMLIGGSWVLLSRSAPWLASPIDALTSGLSDAGAGVAEAVLRAFGNGDTTAAHVAAAIGDTLGPGLVCLLVAEAVGAARAIRNAAAGLLTLAAFSSFFWLPGGEALALLIAALVLDVLLAIGEGLLLRLPVSVVVTAIAGRTILDAFEGASQFHDSAATLARVVGNQDLCLLGLAGTAVAMCSGAVLMLIRSR